MEEYTQITLDQWMQWKEDIRRKLEETAGNFVYIGYRLKQIRDSGMYDGAADIFEFAEREYGLGKSTVSRFIAINEKYSEGGNSLELREEFRNFSSSKLAEMLTLTDAECRLITDKTTIREIRELKNFGRQQDGEETIAGTGEVPPLENCIIDFFKEKKEVLNEVMGYLRMDKPEYQAAEKLINPAGQGSHKKGTIFLFLYDWITGIKYKILMQPEPVSMTWPEFLNEVYKVYAEYDQEDTWTDFYKKKDEKIEHEEMHAGYVQTELECGVEESVATSQQTDKGAEIQDEDKEEAAGINSKQLTGEEEYEDSGQDSVERDNARKGDVVTDDIQGQMDITQFEEYMPKQQVIRRETEDSYMDALREILDKIYEQAEQRQYSYAEELLEAARGTINKIRGIMHAGK